MTDNGFTCNRIGGGHKLGTTTCEACSPEGWEQRMSDRAKERQRQKEAEWAERHAAEEAEFERTAHISSEAEIERRSQEMTYDEAQHILDNPWACGCAGSQQPGWPCYCEMTFTVAKRVLSNVEPPAPGTYIVLNWDDPSPTTLGNREQSAAGFFDHVDGEGYWVLDWGYGVRDTLPNFTYEVVVPPRGETYHPIGELHD